MSTLNHDQNRWRLRMLLFHGGMLLAPLVVLFVEALLKIDAIGHCLFKSVLGFEGPACGISHSVHALVNGQAEAAIHFHPAGPAVMAMLVMMTSYLAVVTTTGWRGCAWAREVRIYKTLELVVIAVLVLGWAAKPLIP